jgi:hypothetical protein
LNEQQPSRKRLTDILHGSSPDALKKAWTETEAAPDMGPIPGGEYVAEVFAGELSESRSGTPGCKVTFRIIEGDYRGRRVWLDLWLTPDALRYTKRDLLKLGVTDLEQLDKPMPKGIVCKLDVVLRTDDRGKKKNEVRTFEVLRIEPPKPDPFAVDPEDNRGDAWEPPARGDTLFPVNGVADAGPYQEGR